MDLFLRALREEVQKLQATAFAFGWSVTCPRSVPRPTSLISRGGSTDGFEHPVLSQRRSQLRRPLGH